MENFTKDELLEINRALNERYSMLSKRWIESSGDEADKLEEQLDIIHTARCKVRNMII